MRPRAKLTLRGVGRAVGRGWRRVRLFVGILAVLGILGGLALVAIGMPGLSDDPPAAASPRPASPVIHRLAGKQVPLPPGNWQVVAERVSPERDGIGPVASMVLFRLNDRIVDAAVLVQANPAGVASDWGLAPGCLRDGFQPRQVHYASDHDGGCAYAAFVDTSVVTGAHSFDPAWRRAEREAVDQGWRMPQSWLSVTYRITDPQDGLQLRYLFHPWPIEEARVPSSPAWRRVYAQRVAGWMEASWPRVAAAFRGRLDTAREATLPDWERNEMSAPLPPNGLSRIEAARQEEARAASRRVATTLTEFGVGWLYLGSAAAGGTLALLNAAASGVVGAAHDMVWGWTNPAIPSRPLPGVGGEERLPY